MITIKKTDLGLVIIVGLFTIIYSLGLYQTDEISYGDIAFTKPIGYRYHSVQFDQDASKVNVIKNYLGIYTSFDVSDATNMLKFQNIYSGIDISIIINFYIDKKR